MMSGRGWEVMTDVGEKWVREASPVSLSFEMKSAIYGEGSLVNEESSLTSYR